MSASSCASPETITTVLTDPTAYGDRRLFDAYRWLRANQTLGLAEARGFSPFWVVTRHADVQTVSQLTKLIRKFGYGAHLCLGQYPARLAMRILFEECCNASRRSNSTGAA